MILKDYLDRALKPTKINEQVEVTHNDVIIKGISAKEVMSGAADKFKKSMPTFYKLCKEVYNDKEMNNYALNSLRIDINKGKIKENMLEKLTDEQIKGELLGYATIVLSGDFTTDAIKRKNEWLKNKNLLLRK